MLNKVWDKIKDIESIENFGNTKILIDTDDKLPNNITLKYAVIVVTCDIKDDDKFHAQQFLEEALIEV